MGLAGVWDWPYTTGCWCGCFVCMPGEAEAIVPLPAQGKLCLTSYQLGQSGLALCSGDSRSHFKPKVPRGAWPK